MIRHHYGLDHPTWTRPECFFYDSANEAHSAAVRTYGEDSGHIVVGLIPEPDPCAHEDVKTFRSVPPRSECRDCGATVVRRWVREATP